MATTRLMPLHAGKGRNTGSAIRSVIGYVSNPGKTRNGELVTGFACDPRTADGDFLLAKRDYLLRTGRSGASQPFHPWPACFSCGNTYR